MRLSTYAAGPRAWRYLSALSAAFALSATAVLATAQPAAAAGDCLLRGAIGSPSLGTSCKGWSPDNYYIRVYCTIAPGNPYNGWVHGAVVGVKFPYGYGPWSTATCPQFFVITDFEVRG